jgi:hypothetical protein
MFVIYGLIQELLPKMFNIHEKFAQIKNRIKMTQ